MFTDRAVNSLNNYRVFTNSFTQFFLIFDLCLVSGIKKDGEEKKTLANIFFIIFIAVLSRLFHDRGTRRFKQKFRLLAVRSRRRIKACFFQKMLGNQFAFWSDRLGYLQFRSLDSDGTEEIRRRLAMATNKLSELKFLWNGQDPQTKLRIVRACIFPIATHGCETWTLGKTI